jgi:DNA replication ATP-dependent helicase Dna2
MYQKKNFKSVSEIKEFFEPKQLYAVTCLASGNLLLAKKEFDVCIIDEASQALEAVVLGPLLLAKKFVLIGDHF